MVCEQCQSGWFRQAYDRHEMGGLYADYRGDRYNQIRERWEPWYTSSWNSAFSDDENLVKVRRGSLEAFLSRYLPGSLIGTVVHVGGDRGQYIPVGERKVVIDPSDRRLVPGVERREALTDLESADLLISAHVLEHLADPSSEISSYGMARWVYVEVPAGVPQLSFWRTTATLVANCISWSPTLWRGVTGPASGRTSGVSRQILRQSEHLNFFSKKGIQTMLEASGRTPVVVEECSILGPDGAQVACLRALAT